MLDESDGPLVLVSAGIGITPIAAIVEDLSRRQPDRQVRIFHADTSHSNHALYAHLRRQVLAMGDAKAQNWYEEDAESAPTLHPARPGRMDLSDIQIPGRDGIHVRSAAVHADDPKGPARQGHLRRAYPLRSLRPRPGAQNPDNVESTGS